MQEALGFWDTCEELMLPMSESVMPLITWLAFV